MRTLAISLCIILLAGSCAGVTIYLRKGGTVSGELVAKDDTKLVLKTADGETTFPWKKLKNSSIKELHPELYERLKAEAIERKKKKEDEMKAEGLVKVGKQWVPKEEADEQVFSRIQLGVRTTEKAGSFKKQRTTDIGKLHSQECHGLLVISFVGLDAKKSYTLKTTFSHHVKSEGDRSKRGNLKAHMMTDDNAERECKIENKRHFRIEYNTSPYYRYKETMKGGWKIITDSGRKKKRRTWGYDSDGWDISIWLDGKLVYEQKRGEKPTWHLVQRK